MIVAPGTMRTLILSGAILGAGSLVAAAMAGHLSGDFGSRLRRECEAIARAVPILVERSALSDDEFIQGCIWRRAGPGGTGE
jgi:hypothetical protein